LLKAVTVIERAQVLTEPFDDPRVARPWSGLHD
jgi:hypothetical protein